jgi:hypothetical protein
MPVFKVQLIGGQFQDSRGNVLANGYLTMKLSSDEEVNDSLICSGIEIRIQLDVNGSVVTSPAQSVWGNDVLLPVNSYYKVTGYTAAGQIAWGPNNQQVAGIGSFDVGTWIPNSVISWTPPLQPLSLEVVGTPLSSQSVLDFINTGNVIFTDAGNGQVSASVSVPTPNVVPQPQDKRFAIWETAPVGFGGGSFQNVVNDQIVSGGSTASDFDAPANSTRGSAHQVNVNALGSRFYQGMPFIYPGRRTVMQGIASFAVTNASTSGGNYYIGFGSEAGGGDPTTQDFAGIGAQKISGGGLGNWKLFTSVGGLTTITDSGIAIPTAAVLNRFKFEIILDSGVCTLFINGTSVCSTSSTLPVANCSYVWYLKDTGNNAEAEFSMFEYSYLENVTP